MHNLLPSFSPDTDTVSDIDTCTSTATPTTELSDSIQSCAYMVIWREDGEMGLHNTLRHEMGGVEATQLDLKLTTRRPFVNILNQCLQCLPIKTGKHDQAQEEQIVHNDDDSRKNDCEIN